MPTLSGGHNQKPSLPDLIRQSMIAWIGRRHLKRPPCLPTGDVDVVWFDRTRARPSVDQQIEAGLQAVEPSVAWSVKNQARMHQRNGDQPYLSVADAVSRWPETATAVAARLTQAGLEIVAPFGLDDLFALVLRPTPSFETGKRIVFQTRVREKRWLERWQLLFLSKEFIM
ncbi:MAG TPA: nucleotidyltransferase family protein [Telmatospirillum sp.]|nr:nucleotidyltransferase family protein [Telmatospirillum sp.]